MGARTQRADARRNRERLVTAARALIAERGEDVPMDEVARSAGVGSGTLYRHFATRQDLLIAVYAQDADDLAAQGRRLLAEQDGGRALYAWVRLVIGHIASRRGLAAAALNTTGDSTDVACTFHESLSATAEELLQDANAHGTVTTGVTATQLLLLANALAAALESAPQDADHLLDLAIVGIAPR